MIAIEKFEIQDFARDVIEESNAKPVLVDFWAEWCDPCKFIGPILEKLASESQAQWKLVTVNTEKYPDLATEWGIRGIPNLKLFYKGEVIDEVAGAMAEADMREWLEARMPSEAKNLQYDGLELIEKGDIKKGMILLEKAIAADATLEQSKIALAKLKLWEAPEEVKSLLNEISYLDQANELLLLAESLTLNRDVIGDSKASDNLWKGVVALRKLDYDQAINSFIEAIIIDKSFKEQLARRLAIAIFHYLGEAHEITRTYRRKFDMALY
jgi:putative thioredoxin